MRKHIKYFKLLIILVLFISPIQLLAQSTFLSKFYTKYSNSIVSIELYNPDSKIYSHVGTGFVYKSNLVITAKHVVNDSTSTYRINLHNKYFTIKSIFVDEGPNDTAIISINGKINDLPLKISTSLPEIGSQTIVIGNPLDFINIISDGYINGIAPGDAILDCKGVILFSNPIAPGNSGGPIFNSKGEVVGIVLALSNSYSQFNYGTSCLQILNTLKKFEKSGTRS